MRKQTILLGAVLACLMCTVWFQVPGSPLVEHDETRYAEISREMAASQDFVVPHLNGVPWYEKAPLLFWAGAASMKLFGPTPWAARLPARLAGLATLALMAWWVGRAGGRRRALLATTITLGTPLGWGVAFLNITDGLLTFFVAASIIAGYQALLSTTRSTRCGLILAAGGAAGLGFLTKGLVAIVFPLAILGLWSLLRRRHDWIVTTVSIGAAAIATALPWVIVVAQREPEYLHFFIVREHFQRYASAIHGREQPLFFMVVVFAAGMAPVLGHLLASLPRRRESLADGEVLLVVWFAFVVLFYSLSRSQLASYAAPAVPAASAYVALRFGTARRRWWPWLVQAGVAVGLVLAATRDERSLAMLGSPGAQAGLIVAAVALLASAVAALLVARRDAWSALPVGLAGYAAVYAALLFALPESRPAREMAALRAVAVDTSQRTGAELVCYRTFVKGLPWLMKAPIPFVEAGGELAAGAETVVDPLSPLVWTEERFWKRWRSDATVMALVDERRIADFEARAGLAVPAILARARRHLLVCNEDLPAAPSTDPEISTALYVAIAGSVPVPIASVPENALAAARQAFGGAPIVRCFAETTATGLVWEIACGGTQPRILEIANEGQVLYTERLIAPEDVPAPALAAIVRHAAGAPIWYVKREHRGDHLPDHFEAVISTGTALREVEVDPDGKLVV